MSTKETTIQVSPRIFDHLGLAAYESLKKCLAELAANSYDADATEVRICVPEPLENGSVIKVTDNGEGMTAEQIEKSYLFIGRDRRTQGQRSSGRKSGEPRLVIGSKGIGKLAGFGVASILRLSTSRDGIKSTLVLDRHNFDDLRTLAEQKVEISTESTATPDGTIIELLSPNSQLSLPDLDTIRRHLFRVLPIGPSFRVYVNDEECSSKTIVGERSLFSERIPEIGDVNGFYVIAGRRLPNYGMAVRVRGRLVKEPSLFGIDTTNHWFFSTYRIYGEINADFLDPESNDNRAHDVINTSRDGFLEDSPIVQKFEEWVKDFLVKIFKGIENAEEEKRESLVLKNPKFEERLNKLPAHVRATAERVARSVFSKLKNVDQDQASELIDWILRYYESNVLKELMSAIVAADMSDVESLSSLIQQWGVKQVGNVVTYIKDQIDIIKRMEDLVRQSATLEKDIHNIVETNLWLLRPGMELWRSNKTLKTILDGHVDKLYELKKDLRPDIVCKDSRDSNRCAVIEFKRPKDEIIMSHVTQALEYKALLKSHMTNKEFDTYVIGYKYDPSVMASKDDLANARIFTHSYGDVIELARTRYEEILKILEQEDG